MSLSESELYILKEVLTKIQYDKSIERYTLKLEDYAHLNLHSSHIKVLKRLCKENDIYLEELPKILKRVDTQELFKQYNELKKQIGTDKTNNSLLQQQLDEVRNKIVEGHMKLVYKLINKYFPNIKNERDKEDIYQTGYEALIELVDKYDSSKQSSFIFFICNYIMQNIVRKVYKSKGNFSNGLSANFKRFIIAKEHFKKNYDREPTKEELMQATGLPQDRVEQLLLIETFLEPETTNYEELEIPSELIVQDFESREIEKILNQNNHLRKIIELLPETHRRVIKLYYGFEDGNTYTNEEIAKIIGNISAQRVQQIRTRAIYLLSKSFAGQYLKDIYGNPKVNPKLQDEPRSIYLYQIFVEDLFIESISKEELLLIIHEMQPNYREIMLLYYGLKDGIKHDYKEISKILGLDVNKIRNNRSICVNTIIKKYIQKHYPNVKLTNIQYLVNEYINTENKRRH